MVRLGRGTRDPNRSLSTIHRTVEQSNLNGSGIARAQQHHLERRRPDCMSVTIEGLASSYLVARSQTAQPRFPSVTGVQQMVQAGRSEGAITPQIRIRMGSSRQAAL